MDNYQVIITNEILNLISEIDEFKGKWQAINTLSPDRLRCLKNQQQLNQSLQALVLKVLN